jgi:MraZ protein
VRVADQDRFVSNFTNRLDAKGRVSIPAPFRAVLARDGFEGLFVHPSMEADAFDCGGNALLREIDSLLDAYTPYSEQRDTLATALLGLSEKLKVDPEGRVQLSESCKVRAGITSEVVFVGLGHKFRIWEPERFRAHLEEATLRLRETVKSLGARGAGGDLPRHGARE